jgi:hypothetical protein
VPTPLPTPQPSPLPSQVPTLFTCTYTDDGDFDPTAYLALAKPKITALDASASPLALSATGGADAYYSRQFGLLSGEAPGTAFSFTATLADGTTVGGASGGGAGLTAKDPAARVDAVLKTATVYFDETSLAVAFQLFDAAERTAVLSTDLAVTMSLQHDTDASLSDSTVCGSPGATTGVGLCSFELDTDWFATTSALTTSIVLTVDYGADAVATSDTLTLTLSKEPSHTALSSANMYATFPYHPKLTGDSFTVPVYAYTDGQALSVWVLQFTFDTDVLTYTSTTTSSFYTSAVVTTGTGTVSISTSGLKSGVSSGDVTGDAILVVTLKFKVNSDATVASHASAFSFAVSSMVNQYSIGFASGKTGQVNDARGGAKTSGTLTVSELAFLKLFAYASQNEFVNTAPLTAADVATSISAVAVRNWNGYGNVAQTSSISCSLEDEADASVVEVSSTCGVTLSDYHSAGSTGVKVHTRPCRLSCCCCCCFVGVRVNDAHSCLVLR